jgi:uroporphyrin-III C-methyltransferase/precorrin-2 dehydrogenase/sirohydrochlorin ferrochelatase
LEALAQLSGTLVLLMAVERIELFAAALMAGGRPAQTPVLVVQHGTTAAERWCGRPSKTWPQRIRAEGIRPRNRRDRAGGRLRGLKSS